MDKNELLDAVHNRRSVSYLNMRYYGIRSGRRDFCLKLIDLYIYSASAGGFVIQFINNRYPILEKAVPWLLLGAAALSAIKMIFRPSQDLYRQTELFKSYSKLYQRCSALYAQVKGDDGALESWKTSLQRINEEFDRLSTYDDLKWLSTLRKKCDTEMRMVVPYPSELIDWKKNCFKYSSKEDQLRSVVDGRIFWIKI